MQRVRIYLIGGIPDYLRIPVTFILFAVAGYFHIVQGKFLPGLVFLILALVLNWIKGYRLRLNQYSLKKSTWKDVTIQEFAKLYERVRLIKMWSSGTSLEKFFRLFLVLYIAGITFIALSVPLELYRIFFNKTLDFILLDLFLIIFYFSIAGSRKVDIPGALDVTVDTLSHAIKYMEKIYKGFRIIPVFKIGEYGEGRIPLDVRLKVLPPKVPDFLYHIQFQVSINKVGNRRYPYFYGVIITKSGFQLERKVDEKFRCGIELVMEFQKTDEAEVCVIRQRSTKTSGYYTDRKAIECIIDTTMEKVKQLLQKQAT